jgi:hypothetical protein
MQPGAQFETTEEMIAAGQSVYAQWEPNHIFGDYTPASDYAIKGLVKGILRKALSISNNPSFAKMK